MSQQEEKQIVEEGNKLIAEFINAPYVISSGRHTSRAIDSTTGEDLNYHSDWNLLMPVVEKIESLGINITLVSFQREGEPRLNRFIIHDVRNISDTYSHIITEHESKLQETWLAVVEFIKFYNAQNKSTPTK